tara:strand:- start:154 stop:2205 length:2052 start_codon:yes stop_codon:yes gene_type:complete
MKIFLADLVHTWPKGGIWTIPLGVGYVASYLIKNLKEKGINCEVKIFKDPNKIIKSIRKENPDVIGLSYYVWNENVNKLIFDIAKQNNKNVFNVGGGPHFTNLNANEIGAKKFFLKQTSCDAYVVNQGEKGFLTLIEKFLDLDKNTKKIKQLTIPGSLINNLDNKAINIKNCNEKFHIGENIGALDDLNKIPSPYLSGLLDEFFDGPFIPILETNRSCPYRCTFCAWGIGTQKLLRFDESRVLDEIDYINSKCKKASTLFIADANFGILERDAIFAKRIYLGYKKNGYPHHVAVQWNKTRPDRILKTAKEFKEIAPVGASMQTINEDVLTAIKRKNLTFDQIVNLQKELKILGVHDKSFSELIIGLPNETKESHIAANKKLIDYGFEVWNYNLHLLPGTEMDDEDYRKKYFKKTGYRLHDNCYGIYDGNKIFEEQETVLQTNKLSIEDFRYFRFFHFLQQMMWSKKWYFDYLNFFMNFDIHPVEIFDLIINELKKNNHSISNIYKNFMKDYDTAESFLSREELRNYWSKDENFNRLKIGDYGKLNMLYTYKIVIDEQTNFNEFLISIAEKIAVTKNLNKEMTHNTVKQILEFQNSKFIKLDKNKNIISDFRKKFDYDFLSWKKNKYKNLNKFSEPKEYNFYLDKDQLNALQTQFKQFETENLNAMLRNMTVYTETGQFFYNIK